MYIRMYACLSPPCMCVNKYIDSYTYIRTYVHTIKNPSISPLNNMVSIATFECEVLAVQEVVVVFV